MRWVAFQEQLVVQIILTISSKKEGARSKRPALAGGTQANRPRRSRRASSRWNSARDSPNLSM